MSAQTAVAAGSAHGAMSPFERYITLWVAVCVVTGIALGQFFPGFFHASGEWKSPGSTCRSACSSG